MPPVRLHTTEGRQEHAKKHGRATVHFRTKHTDDGYELTWCTTCGAQDRYKIDTAPRNVQEGEACATYSAPTTGAPTGT